MSNLFSQDHDQSPGTTFHAPLTHSIPRLKPHNTVSCCSSCGVAFAFRLFHRKHNCYNCGNVICGRCSEHKVKLPKFGYFEPVRICNLCHGYLEIMEMSRSQLVGLPTKRLREYISAYNLPCYNIIEKDDLINVIMAHRPMEGRYEVYYRDHYPIAQPVQTFHETASAIPPSANHARTETQNNASHSRSHYQNTVPPPPPPPRQPSPRQPSRQPSPRQSSRQPSPRQPSPQQPSPQQPSPQQLSSQQQRPSQQHRPNYQSQKQPPSDTAPISLQTIIRDKVDVSKLSIKIIKEILKENCIDYSKMVEKSELVERLEILIKWAKHEMSRDTNDISDDGLCRICCDAQSNCLFMDCGHMCTCLDCGKKLLETKNECPICRETIIKMIRVFRA